MKVRIMSLMAVALAFCGARAETWRVEGTHPTKEYPFILEEGDPLFERMGLSIAKRPTSSDRPRVPATLLDGSVYISREKIDWSQTDIAWGKAWLIERADQVLTEEEVPEEEQSTYFSPTLMTLVIESGDVWYEFQFCRNEDGDLVCLVNRTFVLAKLSFNGELFFIHNLPLSSEVALREQREIRGDEIQKLHNALFPHPPEGADAAEGPEPAKCDD